MCSYHTAVQLEFASHHLSTTCKSFATASHSTLRHYSLLLDLAKTFALLPHDDETTKTRHGLTPRQAHIGPIPGSSANSPPSAYAYESPSRPTLSRLRVGFGVTALLCLDWYLTPSSFSSLSHRRIFHEHRQRSQRSKRHQPRQPAQRLPTRLARRSPKTSIVVPHSSYQVESVNPAHCMRSST